MPIISKDIWITREGEQIEIRHMASSHLLATIHFIERSRFMNAAEVYSEQQLGSERLNAVNYYLQFPIQYETLVEEAVRRHLLLRPTNATGIMIVKDDDKKLDVSQRKRLKK